MLSRRFAALLVAPAALVLAATLMTSPGANAARQEHCPEGIKLGTGVTSYCSSDGLITGVCIKAGTQLFSFTADTDGKEEKPCYEIKGIGTDCVTVGGGGTGRDCKDISGITVYVDKK